MLFNGSRDVNTIYFHGHYECAERIVIMGHQCFYIYTHAHIAQLLSCTLCYLK